MSAIIIDGKLVSSEEKDKVKERAEAFEKKFGRNRKNEERNGPRTLDIDIELFGNKVLATKHLVIPHERIKERAFVLKPLLEILPDCADVHTGRPYREFLENLGTLDGVVYSVENWR